MNKYRITLDNKGSAGNVIIIPKAEIQINPIVSEGYSANFIGYFDDNRKNLFIHAYELI